MKVLVVGGGGREHALAWKISTDPEVEKVFLAPGNPGMNRDERLSVTRIPADQFALLAEFCEENSVDLVVVGPDQALADGLVDFLVERGIVAYGPKKAAARIEASKAFAKEVMMAAGIPTARFQAFTEWRAAEKFLKETPWGDGWVIKADGLALGKGVVVAENQAEALKAAEEFLQKSSMGEAGKKIVIEERLLGRETSGFYLCDGTRAAEIGFACDYKRIFDGDKGPNTGGMGAFSPADWLPVGTQERVRKEVVEPLLAEMRKRGAEFRGTLFVGLMVTSSGPKVIEFNARFGDPETQALLPLLDESLVPWFMGAARGELPRTDSLRKKANTAAVHVVLAAAGYPGGAGPVRKGDPIRYPDALAGQEAFAQGGAKIFFAGVASNSATTLVTNGGRVLGVTALAADRVAARTLAYTQVEQIQFTGMQRRGDVGA